MPGFNSDHGARAGLSPAGRFRPICGSRILRMTVAAEPGRRALANAQRAMPVQVAARGTSVLLHQHVAYGTSSQFLDREPWQGSNEIWHRPGASHEVTTARDVGLPVSEWIETAGTSLASKDSLRREASRLVGEGLDSDLDDSFPHRGRRQVQDEVNGTFRFGAGRWRLAAPRR